MRSLCTKIFLYRMITSLELGVLDGGECTHPTHAHHITPHDPRRAFLSQMSSLLFRSKFEVADGHEVGKQPLCLSNEKQLGMEGGRG